MGRCFAYEGMKALGVEDRYECGLLHRVNCWAGVLGMRSEITPRFDGCLMHSSGSCSGQMRFSL